MMEKQRKITEDDLKIDLLNLEGEWQAQPNLFMNAAEQASQAKMDFNETKAKLDLQARNDPEVKDMLGGKITESGIESWIFLQPEYKLKFLEKNRTEALVKSFEMKKSALENEVKLWAGQYFSGPKEPKEINQAITKQIREKASEEQRDLPKRRRRKV